MSVECRARHVALKHVAATKNIFPAYHTATALTKTAAAIHTATQKRLRLKTRRVSRSIMLKRMIWRVAHSCHLGSQAEFVLGPDEFKSIKRFI